MIYSLEKYFFFNNDKYTYDIKKIIYTIKEIYNKRII